MSIRWYQLESDSADADIPVTLADQTNINAFSRLNSRADEVIELLEGLTKSVEDLEEVETEMELMDEEEIIMWVILWWLRVMTSWWNLAVHEYARSVWIMLASAPCFGTDQTSLKQYSNPFARKQQTIQYPILTTPISYTGTKSTHPSSIYQQVKY